MRPTVVLFDVDGTLVHTGGAGRRALALAFDEIFGRSDALEGVQLGGMTDPLILRAAFRAIGATFDEARGDRVLEAYLRFLPAEVAASPGYRVLPGVIELVRRLARAAGFAVGLGTGNVRRGAEIKLSRGGLASAFAFGGFGCDHEDRGEILRAGALRGAERLGRALDECRVVAVGDTPRDVEAARIIDAECVCVATGGFTRAELVRAGADAVFEDLAHPGALAAIAG